MGESQARHGAYQRQETHFRVRHRCKSAAIDYRSMYGLDPRTELLAARMGRVEDGELTKAGRKPTTGIVHGAVSSNRQEAFFCFCS